ncbi:hypothetical protein [Pseudoruegeria sp. SK021]|uniref:hypothetical protein n=1 Tax=Pseudoruegeria sp. SK021 TaxID=1933035 RepID=UPI000A25562B|nr:hypothetical protein [Pseudoruegeria sp. SK021]OSP55539.1 hypothetical protein BV911_06625 [Pseudoruegeria sp. SK021]
MGLSFGAALADGEAVAIEDIGPTPEMLLTAPSTERLVRDGDETVVDTFYVYLDGCPLLSLSPGVSLTSPPTVTMIDQSGGCAAAAVTAPVVSPAAALEAGGAANDGLLVRLRSDDLGGAARGASEDEAITVADLSSGRALIVDIASLAPKGVFADGAAVGEKVAGPVPPFKIPAIVGGPAGLIPASATPGSSVGLGGGGGFGGGGNGGDFGGGSGGTIGGSSGKLTPTPEIAAVPLPYTLILLFGAFYALRRVVHRR